MKNRLVDVHNMLIAQMEALSDGDLDMDGVKTEAERAKAMCQVAGAIEKNARLALDAQGGTRHAGKQELGLLTLKDAV